MFSWSPLNGFRSGWMTASWSEIAFGTFWSPCAKALGVGLLCGGYSRSELEQGGAYRVYNDPSDLLDHLEELGIR
jgi:hypothetical protein